MGASAALIHNEKWLPFIAWTIDGCLPIFLILFSLWKSSEQEKNLGRKIGPTLQNGRAERLSYGSYLDDNWCCDVFMDWIIYFMKQNSKSIVKQVSSLIFAKSRCLNFCIMKIFFFFFSFLASNRLQNVITLCANSYCSYDDDDAFTYC